jgi:hypothetical protein
MQGTGAYRSFRPLQRKVLEKEQHGPSTSRDFWQDDEDAELCLHVPASADSTKIRFRLPVILCYAVLAHDQTGRQ